MLLLIPQRYNFSSKSQPDWEKVRTFVCCCWYHKGTIFQANHNQTPTRNSRRMVVVDTTKVQFFKQITTGSFAKIFVPPLLLIPQRYNFSSKSQQPLSSDSVSYCCCWYHKGTIFQANHNSSHRWTRCTWVVVDTTKVQFFKQITTTSLLNNKNLRCCWYHKGTIFQANHN